MNPIRYYCTNLDCPGPYRDTCQRAHVPPGRREMQYRWNFVIGSRSSCDGFVETRDAPSLSATRMAEVAAGQKVPPARFWGEWDEERSRKWFRERYLRKS